MVESAIDHVTVKVKFLRTAVKYVELNPVRAKLCKNAWDYRWSSARAHVRGEDDELGEGGFDAEDGGGLAGISWGGDNAEGSGGDAET